MKPSIAATLIALLAAPALRAEPEPERATGIRLGIDLFAGAPAASSTRVRENADDGDRLLLEDDLGIRVIGEARLRLGYDFDADQSLTLMASHIFLYGATTPERDVEYNGTTYQAGRPLESRPIWLVFELEYERVLVRWGEEGRGRLSLGVGVRLDFLHYTFSSFTLAPTSTGSEGREDFDAQALPIPVFGLALRQPLARDLDLYGFGRGFRANHWNSFRTEGGTVYWSESFVEAGAGIAWRAAPWLELTAGYRFLYVDIAETSHEDGNYMFLSTHGGTIGATFLF
jgi:hypothetical protein